ncbi:acyltransferase [Thermaurantimonas aggregans]|uniref:acyltransferase n=1 Tax=Thermaurantimonas aggregans TaxID=2173829 RepID=UPI0023F26CF2|nr:N-acetyltransferase [Thermaurantimonas aggregans]MCX8148577.1 hypothetical protein [Thermaurantimonas aggregans]
MKFNNRNIYIADSANIGKNVKIGDNTFIYENVTIDDGTIIANNCIIGEPLNDYYFKNEYSNPKTYIGKNSLIRSHTIIYAGTKTKSNFQTGHRVTIREFTEIGQNCSIGTNSDIQGFCVIGDYCRFHSYVNVGQKSKIGNFVFIYPFVVLTNDPTPPSDTLIGVEIKDFTQIAAGAVLLPGCVIGSNSLIAANSTVGGIYEDDSFISGSPAKRIGKLSKMPFFNKSGKRHYPWPYHFERGMPWAGIGFDNWREQLKTLNNIDD